MFSLYLSCLVFGGAFTVLSAYGHLADRSSGDLAKHGPLYSLRSLVYSLVGFGGAGVFLARGESSLGAGLQFTFAVLIGLLVGGFASAAVAFLARSEDGSDRPTEVS